MWRPFPLLTWTAGLLLLQLLVVAAVVSGLSDERILRHSKFHGVRDAAQVYAHHFLVQEAAVDSNNETDFDALTAELSDTASQGGCYVDQVYREVFPGFLLVCPTEDIEHAILPRMLDSPGVAAVFQDIVVRSTAVPGEQENPSWALDRMDQDSPALDNNYRYPAQGTGVDVYVCDSGAFRTHNEFRGRRPVCVHDGIPEEGGGCVDRYGHGTHVAATVGGATFGIAKDVNLKTVKVLDRTGAGEAAKIIAGIEKVISRKKAKPDTPAIINLSLGAQASYQPMDDAVAAAARADILVVVAAGNENVDACTTSPAGAAQALTVGSFGRGNDRRSVNEFWGSNWGTCLDVFAPGEAIRSAWNTGVNVDVELAGTSMASPLVAGMAAILFELNPGMTQAQIQRLIRANAARGVKRRGAGSPNRIATLFHFLPEPPDLPPPTDAPDPEPLDVCDECQVSMLFASTLATTEACIEECETRAAGYETTTLPDDWTRIEEKCGQMCRLVVARGIDIEESCSRAGLC